MHSWVIIDKVSYHVIFLHIPCRGKAPKKKKDLPNHSVATPRRKLSFAQADEQPSVPKTEKPNKRRAKTKENAPDDGKEDAADDGKEDAADDDKEQKKNEQPAMTRLRAKTRLDVENPDDEVKGGGKAKAAEKEGSRSQRDKVKEESKSGDDAHDGSSGEEDVEPGKFSASSTGPKEGCKPKVEKTRKRKQGDETEESKVESQVKETKKTKGGKNDNDSKNKDTKKDSTNDKDTKNKDKKDSTNDKDTKKKGTKKDCKNDKNDGKKDSKNDKNDGKKDSKKEKDAKKPEKESKKDKVDIKNQEKQEAGARKGKGKEKEKEKEPPATDVPELLRRDTAEIEQAAKEAEKKKTERLAYKARKGRFYRSLESLGPRAFLITKTKTHNMHIHSTESRPL